MPPCRWWANDPDVVNNTYIDQIVADAKAAIDKAAEMGVTDPNRVGVGGHSYGAFMTANLLAHSDLFKAGVAESGAHNRTLTPFGFQSERRTLWQAPDVYLKMSPFMYADKIKTPMLLIHGEADDNDGTFPIQSDRMYQAVRGNGGIVRLVFLPVEAHGYRGKETIEHVLVGEIRLVRQVREERGGSGRQPQLITVAASGFSARTRRERPLDVVNAVRAGMVSSTRRDCRSRSWYTVCDAFSSRVSEAMAPPVFGVAVEAREIAARNLQPDASGPSGIRCCHAGVDLRSGKPRRACAELRLFRANRGSAGAGCRR